MQKETIQKALEILRSGGVILYPTETSYGVGADATNPSAVALVFKIKGREKNKTLPLIAADIAMAKKYVEWSPGINILAKRYWPGPLTIVSKATKEAAGVLSKGIVAKDQTIALRVSSHPIARILSRRLGKPLVATSANSAGSPPCYTIRTFKRQCTVPTTIPLYIFDFGKLPHRIPSTIVRVVGGTSQLLRKGAIRIS